MHLVLVVTLFVFAQPVWFGIHIEADEEGEDLCLCGKRDISGGNETSLLMNGTETIGIYKYPWMVAISDQGSDAKVCSGTLISPTAILTAAKCGKEGVVQPEDKIVNFLGHQHGAPRISLKVSKIVNHPKEEYDIAIWTLQEALDCSPDAMPICISNEDLGKESLEIIVAGIGKNPFPKDSEDDGPSLIERPAQQVDVKKCKHKTYSEEIQKEAIFCVEGINDTDTCEGESGSTVFAKIDEVFFAFGSATAGMKGGGACQKDKPNVFMNIYYHLSFIKENVKDLPNPDLARKSSK